ncbi:MAG TPA: DUF6146 family protein [Cyclobacteriaceae bacterium]|nr:DUF6146 family protein [Cyclobacteriaceae bacterium]
MKSILKYMVPMFAVMVFVSACGSGKNAAPVRYGQNMILDRGEDDEEYELVIIDSGFDRWFATHSRPMSFHSPQFYESMNHRYVTAWNEKVITHGFRPNSPFQQRINYNPGVDYGLEVNYKLYYYFKYIEDVYGRFL